MGRQPDLLTADAPTPWATRRDTALDVAVQAVPGARRAGVVGLHDAALKVAVTARAVDGAANAALVAVVAEAAGVRPAAVTLVRGATSRRKQLRIQCASAAEVTTVLRRLVTLVTAAGLSGRGPAA